MKKGEIKEIKKEKIKKGKIKEIKETERKD